MALLFNLSLLTRNNIRTFTTSTTTNVLPSVSPYQSILNWRDSRLIYDLNEVNNTPILKTKIVLYERFLQSYHLHMDIPNKCLEFFLCNKPKDIPSSILQYNVLLHSKAFNKLQKDPKLFLNDVENVLKQINELKLSYDSVTYQFLIRFYSSMDNMDKCVELFKEMKTNNILPSRIHYSSIIVGYARLKNIKEAEKWFAELKTAFPDIDPYNITILAAFKEMYGGNPTHIKALENVETLIKKMRAAEYIAAEAQASGVQWSLPRKAVTSTGAEVDKKAAPKGVNAPKKNAKAK